MKSKLTQTLVATVIVGLSLSACSINNPRTGENWQKHDDKPAVEQLERELGKHVDVARAKELYGKAKENAKDGWEIAKKHAEQAWNEYNARTENASDDDEVFFQGSPLGDSTKVARAYELVDTLIVAPQKDASGYNRKDYGTNTSNTVGKVEHRDLTHNAVFDSKRAIEGSFIDPYTGKWEHVKQGVRSSVDVDHIVPLKEAYRSEVVPMSKAQRKEFARDMDNLVLVGATVNRSKGDKDVSDWLPEFAPAVCDYVSTYVIVKAKYNLSVDQAEKTAIVDALETHCR